MVDAEGCSEGQHREVIGEYVYPAINGLSVRFVGHDSEAAGVPVVRIPPQHQDRKTFLVSRVAADGDHMKEIVVDYARRIGDSSQPLSSDEAHRTFKKGQHSHSQRLIRMEEKLDMLLDATGETAAEAIDGGLLDRHIRNVLNDE